MHFLPMHRDCPRSSLQIAEDMYARCINLPSSPFLAASEQSIAIES
jgi:perosamine synthetase